MSDLAQLLPISKAKFNSGEEQLCVNMRNVHDALGVGRDYATWIKDRITKYGFVEHEDYEKFANDIAAEPASATIPNFGDSEQSQFAEPYDEFGEQVFGKARIDYYFTLDAAKEIAMVENNEKGREIRRYFIACEKQLRAQQSPTSFLEALKRCVAIEEARIAAESEKTLIQEALDRECTEHDATKKELQRALEQLGIAGEYSGVCTQGWLYEYIKSSSQAFRSVGKFLSYVVRRHGDLGIKSRDIAVNRWNGKITHIRVYHNMV